MANHKSSVKRARQTIKKTLVNKRIRSEVRSALKSIRTAIAEKNKDVAQKLLPKVQGLLANAGQSSAIEKKKASRTTSRISSQINSL